jgi:hypothetical protein
VKALTIHESSFWHQTKPQILSFEMVRPGEALRPRWRMFLRRCPVILTIFQARFKIRRIRMKSKKLLAVFLGALVVFALSLPVLAQDTTQSTTTTTTQTPPPAQTESTTTTTTEANRPQTQTTQTTESTTKYKHHHKKVKKEKETTTTTTTPREHSETTTTTTTPPQ